MVSDYSVRLQIIWSLLNCLFVLGGFDLFVYCFLVSLECVNICKLPKGDGNGRYDCNILSCAWKAPRVLTGFLASTAHPPTCSLLSCARNGRRTRINLVSSLNCLGLDYY